MKFGSQFHVGLYTRAWTVVDRAFTSFHQGCPNNSSNPLSRARGPANPKFLAAKIAVMTANEQQTMY